jgi:LmbE family N-acetylglucosaminyl deacetylase
LTGVNVVSFGRVLAVSPHMDDAVLSAGAFLSACSAAVIVTVFAGFPPRYDGLSEWDADCGFTEGDDVVALRREEDRRAAEHIGAQARWLDFVDSQYEPEPPAVEAIAASLRALVTELGVETLALPLGINHEDHQRTHEACAMLLRDHFGLVDHWVAWADVPYRARHPEEVEQRLKSLRANGFSARPFVVDSDEHKRAAISEYPTQARGLGAESMIDAERPEQLYLVTRQ